MRNKHGSATLIAIIFVLIISTILVFRYNMYHWEIENFHRIIKNYNNS